MNNNLQIPYHKLLSLLLCFTAFLFVSQKRQALATSDFIETRKDYFIIDSNTAEEITEKITINIKNVTGKYILLKGSTIPVIIAANDDKTEENQEIDYIKKSLEVTNGQKTPVSYNLKTTDNYLIANIKVDENLTKYNNVSYEITYKSKELRHNQGATFLLDIPKATIQTTTKQQNKATIDYSRDIYIETSPNILPIAHIIPDTSKIQKISDKKGSIVYKLITNDNKLSSRIQFGKTEYYAFNLKILTSHTELSSLAQITTKYIPDLSVNIYKISLPRPNPESNQTIFIQNNLPPNAHLEIDEEGNYFIVLKVSSADPTEYNIKGIIAVTRSKLSYRDTLNIPLSTYTEQVETTLPDYSQYQADRPYWPVTNDSIQSIAQNIKKESTTLSELVQKDMDFVSETLTYDPNFKEVNSLNGLKRKGALQALTSKTGVCMEYADLLTTILRAQGIPTRAAFGIGTSWVGNKNIKGGTEVHVIKNIDNIESIQPVKAGHQWLQIWIPHFGWLSLDPTWSDTLIKAKFIGPDTNHILTTAHNSTATSYIDNLILTSDTHVQDNFDTQISIAYLNNPEIQTAFSSEKQMQNLGYINLLDLGIYKPTDLGNITTRFQASYIGKLIATILPIVVMIMGFFVVVAIVRGLVGILTHRLL